MVHGRRWFMVKSRYGCSRSPMVHRSRCPIDGSQICEEDGGRLPRRCPWLQKIFFTLFFQRFSGFHGCPWPSIWSIFSGDLVASIFSGDLVASIFSNDLVLAGEMKIDVLHCRCYWWSLLLTLVLDGYGSDDVDTRKVCNGDRAFQFHDSLVVPSLLHCWLF
ncbi:hypothetical protein L6452_08502 [Arctium lappa]|uniref:Uncharacterized protein n=1 Tax=Arctium lappa TaxID=4217 RepID=A0ACB9DIJ6_ARCLA|nr:hypothetical protein L6452_08502 [Arctium lappa]